MNKNDLFGGITSLVANGGVIMGLSTMDALLQSMGFILAIISGIVSITYTIYRWYVSAKKDGKITIEEVINGIKEVAPMVEQVMDLANNKEDDLDGDKNK